MGGLTTVCGGRMFWKNEEEMEGIVLEANKQKGKSSFEPFGSLKIGRTGLSVSSDDSMTIQRLAGSEE